jgi:hypothetical protein
MDSRRKSELDEPSELSDIEVEACCNELGGFPSDGNEGKGILHSGRVIMPITASRYTGLSVPDID